MAKRFSRTEALHRLRAELARDKSLLVVGAGNGLSARCAEEGGADLLVVYNSGYFRVNGLPSLVGGMPVGDANDIMLRLGRESIRPRLRNVPVIAGVYAVDPTRDLDDVLDSVDDIGFSGVINFPTVGRHEGSYRRELEAAGYGFSREVELVRKARERELLSLAYVYNAVEARLMAQAGVDVLIGHMGLTVGGAIGAKSSSGLEQAAAQLETSFVAASEVREDLIFLSHGGPISSAADAEFINQRTRAVGFVAASSFERIPIENALVEACRSFKEIPVS
ncbi:phosphoenolpyruvate hydrolase family protein [Variovorax sp. LT1R20]|uniref:phosphoenolpyruvate hydrolase family protein n=1 Tax=Variovorax sp. LT1R20 TaxID=3443729 RepID=UPI003F48145B